MSAHSGNTPSGHDEDHEHDGVSAIHATLRSYLTGFFLAAIMTLIPFALVMSGNYEKPSLIVVVVLGLAAAQIVVHMVYFLHMSTKSEGGWNLVAFVFTVLLVVITLSGSIWIMYHLNSNMNPMMQQALP